MAAGLRSLLAPWYGGASADFTPAIGGRRSMLAPWIGGASAGDRQPVIPGGIRVRLAPRDLLNPDEEDELLLALCGAACAALGRLQ